MFTLPILIITALTTCLPLFSAGIAKLFKLKRHPAPIWLPTLAALLFFFSFYLPDINISPATSTFQQHFVGGGVYSVLLYIYAKRLFGWKFNWVSDLVLLFAWVSTLGVANKLLEFALAESHLMILDMSDAYWDLLANTIGAYIGYGVARLISLLSTRSMKTKQLN